MRMFNNEKYQQASRSIFMSSMFWFANVAAGIAAFFGTGPAHQATVGWVRDFTIEQYGYAMAGFVEWAWWFAIAGLLFTISRASIATLIVMGAFAVAVRFL